MFGRSQDAKKSSTDKVAEKRMDSNKDNEKREKEKPGSDKPMLGKDGGLLRMAAEKNIDKKKK